MNSLEFTCVHQNPVRPGSAFTEDQCRVCWLRAGNEHVAVPQPAPSLLGDGLQESLLRLPCVHEGPVLEYCSTCSKERGELRHVRDCAMHERCVRDKRAGNFSAELHSCHDCPDYAVPRANGKRHLLYHVYPIKGNGVWQLNLDRLKARLPLFDGERHVAIVTAENADPPEAVQEYLADDRTNYLVLPNNSKLREVASWPLLWERVAHLPGLTFYGHAKGVTRPVNRGVSIHRWANLLYALNLDFWPAMAELLGAYPIAGAFQKIGYGFQGSRSTWHYSGSFFWVRNDGLGPRWKEIDQWWWGNEAWPGLHWQPDQAGCLFHRGQVPGLDMYKLNYVRSVEEEFERWKSQNIKRRSVIG